MKIRRKMSPKTKPNQMTKPGQKLKLELKGKKRNKKMEKWKSKQQEENEPDGKEIGLVEFNEEPTKRGCRIDECQEGIGAARKISLHRRNATQNSITGLVCKR